MLHGPVGWRVSGQLLRLAADQRGQPGWQPHRLADDLCAEFPGMRGFSGRNLQYMASAARAWPGPIAQQPAAQLPWGHIMVLLDRLDDQAERDWYAAAAAEHGWTRNVLLNQIKNQLHQARGRRTVQLPARLPQSDSELAQALTRDPYVFDFLGITAAATERDLEQRLIDSLQRTLSEFGCGFSFVGRQVHFDVDGQDVYLDLLFFHTEQLRYVFVELKIGPFEPQYTGQLGFYVSVVEDQLRRPHRHAPTVGILLCADATIASCGTPSPAPHTRSPSPTTPSPIDPGFSPDRCPQPPSSRTS
ncbi:PDDEXK nuclease domain-containing protein [Kribbella sp. NPDC050820]|uniref:PDDEXK nuclease domain-containing protein n=1 Tax=Kribbella sp. NPDC050820 TaxID=3155408 RepID=UPI0034069837